MSRPVPIDQHKLDGWFRRTFREFTPLAKRFAGQPIVYVEIGTWAGPASEWVCRNVLTHPDSRGFGIDPYDEARERRRDDVRGIKALAAKRVSDAIGERYQWIYEPSDRGLVTLRERLAGRPIDLLYIDGIHEAPGTLSDFTLAWPMLRVGSIVIFDDYVKGKGYIWPHVKDACAAVETAYRWYVKPIHKRRQYSLEVVRKSYANLHDGKLKPAGDFPTFASDDVSDRKVRLGL